MTWSCGGLKSQHLYSDIEKVTDLFYTDSEALI